MTSPRSIPADPLSAAKAYRGRGHVVHPTVGKRPVLDGWSERLPAESTDLLLEEWFGTNRPCNVGLLLGRLSAGLIDLDLDSRETVAAAEILAPPSGWIFGRKGRPRSHRAYVVEEPGRHLGFDDPLLEGEGEEKSKLVELRGDGCQTIFPPGVHAPTKERIGWYVCEEPGQSDWPTLVVVTRRIAAAGLLGRYWPAAGSRHKAALAVGGALARMGTPVEDAVLIVRAVCAAAGDDEEADRVRAVEDSFVKLVHAEPATGWPELGRLLGEGKGPVVTRVREWLTVRQAPGFTLPAQPPWPSPLAAEAFHGLAGDAVRVLEPATEADPAALLLQLLVGFGNVAGRGPHFVVEADRHGANEYLVLVGRTSKARKGSSWGRTVEVLCDADAAWAEDRVQGGLSSGEGLVWAVRDAISKRERVKERGEPVRFEEVEADPGVQDKRLLVFEAEFAGVLKQTERLGNTLSTVVRQAWDTGNLRTLVKNNPARASGAHISLVGHITSEELCRYLSETEVANGFGNRFLWACVERSKVLPHGGTPDPEALAGVRQRLAGAVAFARASDLVARDEAADDLWCEVYAVLSEGRPGLTGALLARAEAHVMRLALIYALLDRSASIEAEHLLAALAVWRYVEDSVRHVFGDRLGDPLADELLQLLRGASGGLTRTDLRNLLGRHQSADRMDHALGLLLKHRLVRQEQQRTDGRPAERWYAT
jgi:hypothetical protein